MLLVNPSMAVLAVVYTATFGWLTNACTLATFIITPLLFFSMKGIAYLEQRNKLLRFTFFMIYPQITNTLLFAFRSNLVESDAFGFIEPATLKSPFDI